MISMQTEFLAGTGTEGSSQNSPGAIEAELGVAKAEVKDFTYLAQIFSPV